MLLTWLGHASFKLKSGNTVIYLDPYAGEGYDEPADLILCSHHHYDHWSKEKINKVRIDETRILTTKEVAAEIHGAEALTEGLLVKHGEIEIRAVPAYNLRKTYHPRGFGIGILITLEKKTVYHCGDTDYIPEMRKLLPSIVLVPVGGVYTMNAKEAAEAVLAMAPPIAIPMHYGSIVGTRDDADLFRELVQDKSDTKVHILEPGQEIEL
ncbi:MBL fold metallo-hydrolase [Candidatus Woesearchaeota archaeon]|nr:MBL fold metallo-hydrolase [Candidatus Woesearchaeota archaeon]